MKASPCPFCHETVPLSAVAKAPLPDRIRCQACGETITIDGLRRFLVVYSAIALAIVVIGLIVFTPIVGSLSIALIPVAVIAFLYDFLASVVVHRTATFVKPSPR
jgi:uncharacterized membrane protein YdbT with pleckstrin-like domain